MRLWREGQQPSTVIRNSQSVSQSILTDFFLWYSVIIWSMRSRSWNMTEWMDMVPSHVCVCVSVCLSGCTIWLDGREGRFCIISSISWNFRAMAWTSAWRSRYSAYWSLNTALYWSLSSSLWMLGYFLWKNMDTEPVSCPAQNQNLHPLWPFSSS